MAEKVLVMDYHDKTLTEVSCIRFIQKNGLSPYLYKLTNYIPIACNEPDKKKLKCLEGHYEQIANFYMSGLLDNEKECAEILLVMLTNAIGFIRGIMKLSSSDIVLKLSDKIGDHATGIFVSKKCLNLNGKNSKRDYMPTVW